MSAEPIKKEVFRPLSVLRVPTRSNQRRIEWDVVVSADTTLDDLLNPIFWSHVSGSTFNGDINYCDVHWEDKSQLAKLYVKQYTGSAAKMELLQYWNFDKSAKLDLPEDYDIKWTGPSTKFRVIRKKDNQVIRDGFASKEDAGAFINTLPK